METGFWEHHGEKAYEKDQPQHPEALFRELVWFHTYPPRRILQLLQPGGHRLHQHE